MERRSWGRRRPRPCAAERQPHQRALPRHPHREGADLVARDRRVVADPALGRPSRHVVHDAVAVEHGHGPVVHRDGTETSTVFLHSPRTRIRFGSTPNVSPTAPAAPAPARTDSRAGGSASRSRSSGASRSLLARRADLAQLRGGLIEPERDVDAGRRPAANRRPDHADDVLAAGGGVRRAGRGR